MTSNPNIDSPLHNALEELFPDNQGIITDKNGFKVSGLTPPGISVYYNSHKVFSLHTRDTWTLRDFCEKQGIDKNIIDDVGKKYALNLDGNKGVEATKVQGKSVSAELKHLTPIEEDSIQHDYLKARGWQLSVDRLPKSLYGGLYQAEQCLSAVFQNKYDNITAICFTKLQRVSQDKVQKFNNDNDDARITIGSKGKNEKKAKHSQIWSSIPIHRTSESDELIVCEGIEDGLSLLQGVEKTINIEAIFGAEYFNVSIPEHITKVYISYDNDPAGKENAEAFCDHYPYLEVYLFPAPKPFKDFGEVMMAEDKRNAYDLSRAKCIQDYDAEGVPDQFKKITPKTDLLLEFEEEEQLWAVDNLIPEVGYGQIHALPKQGKSLLAMDIACSIVMGRDVIGRPVKKGNVFYFDSESDTRRVVSRFTKQVGKNWKKKLGIQKNQTWGLFYYNDAMDYRKILRKIRDDVMKYRPSYVVFDTLVDFLPQANKEKKDYEFDARRTRQLRNFARKYNLFIQGISHDNQSGSSTNILRVQGTSGNIAKDDVIIGIYKDDDDSIQATLSITGKDTEARNEVIELDKESLRWEYKGEKKNVEFKKNKQLIIPTIESLCQNDKADQYEWEGVKIPYCTPSQVAEVFPEIKARNIQVAMDRIHHDGDTNIIRVAKGKYTTRSFYNQLPLRVYETA